MDELPILCIDKITQYLAGKDPPKRLVKESARCALVGNSVFTTIAHMLEEKIDPGCTRKAQDDFKKRYSEWEDFVRNFDSKMALLSTVDPTKKLPELKQQCRSLGISPTGTKPQLCARLNEYAIKEKNKLQERRDNPPTLQKCFVTPEMRKEIFNKRMERATATDAKSRFMLNDKDLAKIPHVVKHNHRYGGYMRLYLIDDLENFMNQKYKDPEEERARREAMTNKRNETRQRNIEQNRIKIQQIRAQLHTNINALLNYSDDARITLSSNEPIALIVEQLNSMWGRYVALTTALTARNCNLRNDSKICRMYIEKNIGEISNIVETMLEMKFLFAHTKYSEIRGQIANRLAREWVREQGFVDWNDVNERASNEAKSEAMKRWSLRNSVHAGVPERLKQLLL